MWGPGDPLTTLVPSSGAHVVQITDAAGHALFNADGTINLNPATRLPDAAVLGPFDATTPLPPYFVLGGSTGPYTVTMRGTASGAYNVTVLNAQLGASFQSIATTPGSLDTFTLNPKGSVRFATTAAQKKLTVQLLAHAADHSEYSAVLTTQAARAGSELLGFDATTRAFTYTQTGAATRYQLTLNGYDRMGRAITLVTASLRLNAGETASFQAVDWRQLKTKGVQLTITKSNGRRQFFMLKNRRAPIRLARPIVRIRR